jgi:Domain of unknown function (DUF5134)
VVTPDWMSYALVTVMVLVGVWSASRIFLFTSLRSLTTQDFLFSECVCVIAMVGMLVPRATLMSNSAWERVFTIGIAWYGYRVYRSAWSFDSLRLDLRCEGHLIMIIAMCFMFAVVPSGGENTALGMAKNMDMAMSTPGPMTAGSQFLSWILAALLVMLAGWEVGRLAVSGTRPAADRECSDGNHRPRSMLHDHARGATAGSGPIRASWSLRVPKLDVFSHAAMGFGMAAALLAMH